MQNLGDSAVAPGCAFKMHLKASGQRYPSLQ